MSHAEVSATAVSGDTFNGDMPEHSKLSDDSSLASTLLFHQIKNTPRSMQDLHDSGKCKPCPDVKRPNGCHKGLACRFCHLCPDEVLVEAFESKKAFNKKRQATARKDYNVMRSSMRKEGVETDPSLPPPAVRQLEEMRRLDARYSSFGAGLTGNELPNSKVTVGCPSELMGVADQHNGSKGAQEREGDSQREGSVWDFDSTKMNKGTKRREPEESNNYDDGGQAAKKWQQAAEQYFKPLRLDAPLTLDEINNLDANGNSGPSWLRLVPAAPSTSRNDKSLNLKKSASSLWEPIWELKACSGFAQEASCSGESACLDGESGCSISSKDGKEATTMMLCNIPCRLDKDAIIDAMDSAGFAGAYVNVFLPDRKNRRPRATRAPGNIGYAFVTFESLEHAEAFALSFHDYQFLDSPKRCIVKKGHFSGIHGANEGTLQQGGQKLTF